MDEHLNQLELVLGAEIACLTAIKNWLPRKLELIKLNRRTELEAFTRREEEQVARLQQAESQRHVLVTLIARELGLEGTPPLAALLDHVEPARAGRLAERGAQLEQLVAQIRDGQQLVAELLRLALDYTHFTMDVFARLATAVPPTGYGRFGDVTPVSTASWLVDRQA